MVLEEEEFVLPHGCRLNVWIKEDVLALPPGCRFSLWIEQDELVLPYGCRLCICCYRSTVKYMLLQNDSEL